MANKRNVLFVIIDQLRADCLTGALADHINLPNLRALMADGLTFTRHYTVTNPCGPARASMLTGLYAMNHRSVRNGTPLADGITNIAREMRKAGYDPMLFGYTDTSLDPRSRAVDDPEILTCEAMLPDFTEVVEMRSKRSLPWHEYLRNKGYKLPERSQFYVPVPAQPGQKPEIDDPTFFRAEDSEASFLTSGLLAKLDAMDRGWFAHVTYVRPHHPFVAPAPYNHMYDPEKLPPPVRAANKIAEASTHPYSAALLDDTKLAKFVKGFDDRLDNDADSNIQALRALYLGMASEVDANVGRIIAHLKATGQYDNTLLIVTSDHGEMLGDHYMWNKNAVYEPAFHVPLIIRDPGNAAMHGTQVGQFTETVDLCPTILAWAGQRVPTAMNGHSLLPFLRGETPAGWRDHVFMELELGDPEAPKIWQKTMHMPLREANVAMLREDRYKLIHFNGGVPPLLFDMLADPGELQNLAPDPAHAATLLRLTRKMLDHRMRHADHTLSDMKVTASGTVNYTPE